MKRLATRPFQAALLMVLLSGMTAPLATQGQELVTAPAGHESLSDAWRWALSETGTRSAWIVWQISSILDERVVPRDFFGGPYNVSRGLSMDGLLAGHRRAQQPYTRQHDLLLMILLEGGRLSRLRVALPHSLQQWRYPVYWLDEVSNDESFRLLTAEMSRNGAAHLTDELIHAIGLHNHRDRTAFLHSRYTAAAWEPYRPAILTSLALQQSAEIEALMLETAADDQAGLEEREAAIEALTRYDTPAALSLLSALTDERHPPSLREEAVEGLAYFDAEKVEALLNALAWFDGHSRIRATAVESLAGLATAPAYARLLGLARDHPSADTREEALQSLLDSLF